MVEKVQRMKEEGRSLSEMLRWLEWAASHTESFLIPQDFSFLRRGGRLTPVAAALGSVLKLKPVMKLTEDGKRIDKCFVKRTLSAAVKGVIEHMKQAGVCERHIAYVVHARGPPGGGKGQGNAQPGLRRTGNSHNGFKPCIRDAGRAGMYRHPVY